MAFGRDKNEVFQRISTVTETAEQPVRKKKKNKKQEPSDSIGVNDTSMWRSSGDNSGAVQHVAPTAPDEKAVRANHRPAEVTAKAAPSAAHSAAADRIREVGSRAVDSRPEIGYTMTARDEDVTGGLYSDSGRTVTMVMRLISYLMFICGPLYFVGRVFALIGTQTDEITMGLAVSTVIDGVIGCVLLASAGFIIIALIKILQNLMALQKKKPK